MSIRSIRERVSTSLLRSGTAMAIDQRELENSLYRSTHRPMPCSSVHGAIAMARWVDSVLLWLAWRLLPPTSLPTARTEFTAH